MYITNWPMDKIMQLPDHCFGRKWSVITNSLLATETVGQWLCKTPLPEVFVLWSLCMSGFEGAGAGGWFKIALGDHEPADDGEFDAFERIYKGDLENVVEEGGIFSPYFPHLMIDCRQPIRANGRRFAIQKYNASTTHPSAVTFIFTISSIPKEVPDWLISGHGRGQ